MYNILNTRIYFIAYSYKPVNEAETIFFKAFYLAKGRLK